MGFNRKERLKMAKKIGKGSRPTRTTVDWRMKKLQKKTAYEAKLIEYAEQKQQQDQTCPEDQMETDVQAKSETKEDVGTVAPMGNQYKNYILSVAVPGSILNNAQGPELRTYLAGQIARTCAVFCVDEVVVYDESARITDNQINAYYSGTWAGAEKVSSSNAECNLHLARILEYLECPQYLRKHLFPIQRPLKFSGVLNPLDGMHHLRATDMSIPYREGVVINKPFPKGALVDVGLDKDLEIRSDYQIPPKTRITVKLMDKPGSKRYHGEMSSAQKVMQESGIYWGYSVRIAKSLSDALQNYDVIIGTSERGVSIPEAKIPSVKDKRVLVVFGGLDGLEAAVEADEEISVTDPADLFSLYVNSLPGQGSRIIRTEEAIPITLTALKSVLGS